MKKQFDRNETTSQRILSETRNQEIYSAKIQKNIVSARSQGHPTINDIAVNDKTLGVIVQPYKIHTDIIQRDNQLVTWKQISHKKNNLQCNSAVSYNFSPEFQLLNLDRENEIDTIEKEDRTEKELLITKNDFSQVNDELKDSEVDKLKSNKLKWLNGIQNLNQTYLIKDSEDTYNELPEFLHNKRKPIKHSPRVEFYFKNTENENEFNKTKSDRKIIANDEEIRTIKQELKINIENKEEIKVMEYKIEKLNTNSEYGKNNWKVDDKEDEVRKLEKFNIDIEDKDNWKLIDVEDKVASQAVKKLEVNIKGKKNLQRMDDTNITEFDKLSVNKEDEKDKQIDSGIIENIKYTRIEENEQNLLDFDEHIQLSQNASNESFQKLKMNSADCNNEFILDLFQNFFETSSSKHDDPTFRSNDDKNNLIFSDNFINHTQDDLNLKDEVLQYESDTCCNLLKLQENAAAFICDQSDTNNIISLNNYSNRTDPEDEILSRQSNVICCNSLDLTENTKIISSISSRAISPEKDSTKNTEAIETTKNAEATKLNEEMCENDLIILYNKDSERNLKELNSETSLLQNSEILANESDVCTNNIPLQIKINEQCQEQFFESDNFENIENRLKNGKTDFNVNIDRRPSDKSNHSIIKTEVTSEDLRKKNIDNMDYDEFNYGSDNILRVREHNTRDANDLVSSVTLKDNVETQYRRDEIFLKANINFSNGVSNSTRRATKKRPVNSVEIKHKIRESMNRLRGSTDSLISSIEFIDLVNIRRPKANYAYEQESIEIIRPRRSKVFRGLPDIKNDSAKMREDSERYWERASRISRNKLIDLDSVHTGYKFVKRNPRVLPPVPSPSLIERR